MRWLWRHFVALPLIHKLLWLLIWLPGIPFVIVTIVVFLIIYFPQPVDDSVTTLPWQDLQSVTSVTVIAHGLKDTNRGWAQQLADSYTKRWPKVSIANLDWSKHSANALNCSVLGRRIGHQLGEKLSESTDLKSVHLIGHSCGGFVVFGVCEVLKNQRPDIEIQSTYLDPVSIYGGLFQNFGLDNFGHCADFSDAYIDTEDRVPGSNTPLKFAYTFDVTKRRMQQQSHVQPHLWPTQFYRDWIESGQAPLLSTNPMLIQRYPKGKFQSIEN